MTVDKTLECRFVDVSQIKLRKSIQMTVAYAERTNACAACDFKRKGRLP
jgi:hypothetical protein